jgi:hypothetical protein
MQDVFFIEDSTAYGTLRTYAQGLDHENDEATEAFGSKKSGSLVIRSTGQVEFFTIVTGG